MHWTSILCETVKTVTIQIDLEIFAYAITFSQTNLIISIMVFRHSLYTLINPNVPANCRCLPNGHQAISDNHADFAGTTLYIVP